MKKIFNYYSFILAISLLVSCSKDDNVNIILPEGEFTNGYFVLNEGGYNDINASVSFVSENGEVFNSIFSSKNNRDLGDVAQHMGLYGDLAYIVVNNSNTIEVVNRYTFKHVVSIEDQILNPRYIIFEDNQAYVTNWGDPADTTDDYVAVINLDTHEVVKKIAVGEGPEKLIENNGKIYVAHQGGWGYGNSISVIDIASRNLESTIQVNDVPSDMNIYEDFLYVLSAGKLDWTGEETLAALSKINLATQTVEEQLEFSEGIHPGFLEKQNDNLYYVIDREIYQLNTGEFKLPKASLFSTEAQNVSVLYGFKIHENTIYIADAKDYTSNGEVFTYSVNGEYIENHSVQLIPNGFYFNN